MSEEPSSGRYFAAQFYIGTFEIMDRDNDEPVATCQYHFDQDGSEREIELDARTRAEAIAAALNLAGFDWRPPKQFEPYDLD